MSSYVKAAIALAAAVAGGCATGGPLGDDFGASTRVARNVQAVRPPRQECKPPVNGLDSQESSIVSAVYRKSLAPKGQTAEEEPILFVAPARPNAGSERLAPSVPPKDK